MLTRIVTGPARRWASAATSRAALGGVDRGHDRLDVRLAGELLERLGAAGDGHHARARARERERRGAADAAAGAGDERDALSHWRPPRSGGPRAQAATALRVAAPQTLRPCATPAAPAASARATVSSRPAPSASKSPPARTTGTPQAATSRIASGELGMVVFTMWAPSSAALRAAAAIDHRRGGVGVGRALHRHDLAHVGEPGSVGAGRHARGRAQRLELERRAELDVGEHGRRPEALRVLDLVGRDVLAHRIVAAHADRGEVELQDRRRGAEALAQVAQGAVGADHGVGPGRRHLAQHARAILEAGARPRVERVVDRHHQAAAVGGERGCALTGVSPGRGWS